MLQANSMEKGDLSLGTDFSIINFIWQCPSVLQNLDKHKTFSLHYAEEKNVDHLYGHKI